MEIRSFNKETDYKELYNWWGEWGLPQHHQNVLSENGLIISIDGVNIASAFIYSTDSYICWLEHLTSNNTNSFYMGPQGIIQQGKYYIVHFKELFALDGKKANLTVNDVQRRNRIAQLLADWGLINIVDVDKIQDIAPLNQIKVLAFRDKQDWILQTKYNIGSKKKRTEETE